MGSQQSSIKERAQQLSKKVHGNSEEGGTTGQDTRIGGNLVATQSTNYTTASINRKADETAQRGGLEGKKSRALGVPSSLSSRTFATPSSSIATSNNTYNPNPANQAAALTPTSVPASGSTISNLSTKAAEIATSTALPHSSRGAGNLSPNISADPSPIMSRQVNTVPCQYRTGRTLGSGTYAIVKEAVHIKTGKYYACKVVNKKLMEGREHMIRNEIAVLKRVSSGHQHIVTLHDYFETTHNLYLCFDLCTGGELFDRICAKGNYYEADAAELVRTIMEAVKYIHDSGIVHRDLKPENLLFRTKAEDADIMIADFGLSRIMEEDQFQLLHEICGTPGYMAPEIFKKIGHGKPVDIWAMGVITYFLLCGFTPFDRDTQREEMEAICKGDYKFEPVEYWQNVSPVARDFVSHCLTIDPTNRPTAAQALKHRWLASDVPHFVPDPNNPTGGPADLLPNIRKGFDARKTFRKAIIGVLAKNRFSVIASEHSHLLPLHQQLAQDILQYKENSEKEIVDEDQEVHGHDLSSGNTPPSSSIKETFDAEAAILPPNPSTSPLVEKLAQTKLSDA